MSGFRRLIGYGPAALAAALTIGLAPAPFAGSAAQAQDFAAVPRAECGADDRVETMQGRMTLAERFAPQAAAFNCNLQLVGHFPGEGSGWGLNALGDCVFMTTYQDERRPVKLENPGTYVLDVSDSANPRLVTMLTSPAMLNANESLDFAAGRGLMIGQAYQLNQQTAFPVDIYDVSDCNNPKLLSSTDLPKVRIHGGAFTQDGNVYFGASCCGPWKDYELDVSAVIALDLTDPANPKEITRWIPENPNWQTHWLSLSADGTKAYVTLIELGKDTPAENGVVVLDISSVQPGAANAEMKLIGQALWEDTGFGEFNTAFVKDGTQYLLNTDMSGAYAMGGGIQEPTGCVAGRPNWGDAQILDMSDDANPKRIARIMMEVHDPANCAEISHDPVQSGGYSPAFCDFDAKVDPKLLACGQMEGGLRVFDVRDLGAIRELAYYKPAPTRAVPIPGSAHFLGRYPINTADSVVVPRFRDGSRELWFNAMDNGFMTVRFSDAFIAANPDLFAAQ